MHIKRLCSVKGKFNDGPEKSPTDLHAHSDSTMKVSGCRDLHSRQTKCSVLARNRALPTQITWGYFLTLRLFLYLLFTIYVFSVEVEGGRDIHKLSTMYVHYCKVTKVDPCRLTEVPMSACTQKARSAV